MILYKREEYLKRIRGFYHDTEIIKVNVSDEDSKQARNIANEIGKVFTKEIKEIYNLENVSIVDKAIMAEEPYNMTYMKDNIIFLAIGLVISCGIIFMIYYFDTTIKSTDEIEEKLGLSVIGVVPEEKGGHGAFSKRRQKARASHPHADGVRALSFWLPFPQNRRAPPHGAPPRTGSPHGRRREARLPPPSRL